MIDKYLDLSIVQLYILYKKTNNLYQKKILKNVIQYKLDKHNNNKYKNIKTNRKSKNNKKKKNYERNIDPILQDIINSDNGNHIIDNDNINNINSNINNNNNSNINNNNNSNKNNIDDIDLNKMIKSKIESDYTNNRLMERLNNELVFRKSKKKKELLKPFHQNNEHLTTIYSNENITPLDNDIFNMPSNDFTIKNRLNSFFI